MEDKRIISAALTGNWGNKSNNPAMPLTPTEIAESAYECYQAGAAIVHLHMRDENGNPTMNTERFRQTIALIQEKCDVVINMTSSGEHTLTSIASDDARVAPFLVLKPEMSSYDCGTVNWMHKTIFENSPQLLEKLGKAYQEVGVKPELEIFDGGMIYTTLYYLKQGILKAPLHYQFIMGAPGGMDGTVNNLAYLRSLLPEGATWSASGLGAAHIPIMLAALAMGGHVRVGLEDNIYYEKGVLAKSNAQLVERAVNIMKAAGMRPATPNEAREILSIKR
ncbi:MAG: 3-keto-5-aminohexanoate cleavage protein [Firmicutes bacterium]|nr:3-keto-5-aminohexanoate cleavage protein [Bacillota bacterium]